VKARIWTGASVAALAAVLLTSAVLYMPLCALAHRCGCTWAWAGADVHCNVHAASGPHCPWCQHWALGGVVAVLIGGGQVAVFRGLRRRAWSPSASGLLAAASFAVIAPASAALAWIPTDYPHLFQPDVRQRLGIPAGPVRCVMPASPRSH
jgi:hypothetical protein